MSYNNFRDAYSALKAHAETLRNQQDPNIDDLLNIVQDSVAAYKVCQQRIAAVDEALQAALGETSENVRPDRGDAEDE